MKKLLAPAVIALALAFPTASKADYLAQLTPYNGGFYISTTDGYWCQYADADPVNSVTSGNRIFSTAIVAAANKNIPFDLFPAWRAGWGAGSVWGGNGCVEDQVHP